jgi:hypothetical protein
MTDFWDTAPSSFGHGAYSPTWESEISQVKEKFHKSFFSSIAEVNIVILIKSELIITQFSSAFPCKISTSIASNYQISMFRTIAMF